MKKLLVGFFTVLVLFMVIMAVLNYVQDRNNTETNQVAVAVQPQVSIVSQSKAESQPVQQQTNAGPFRVTGKISVGFKDAEKQ